MTALAPIADKLRKLVRLLTSDRNGKVVAAARGINGILNNARRAFAWAIESERASGREPSRHAIACECAAHSERLRDQREWEFVADVVRW